MRHVEIRTIPHKEHRYPTTGDYWKDRNGIEQIRVSYLPDWRHGFLVMVHELLEDGLVQARGIPEEDVTAFDIQFEEDRSNGLHETDAEPGDHPGNPYYKEHQFATVIEKLVCHELGIDWFEYSKTIGDLG